ncbi:hypothetical protein [Paenibacillus ehimensis]|uniref:Uncharacterized protein n=1 Tax=Paenibacillus ehimensis TaxID=79264 RepID=A0ABT8VLX6_9BACL|nr:hypothetical protein [Paenibacillus ehimensis]MDO3681961.1 hypothetical protein [Paenibacillus ehimensis]MEC0211849.1 hypothetical protein [Paenibacillus ehimensis]
MGKRIENDEQYKKALDWLITTAAELAGPLADPLADNTTKREREKKIAVYERTSEHVRRYRRSEMARMFPGLRKVYRQLGWEIDDPGGTSNGA